MEERDPFAEAVGRLSDEGLALEISGRTFRIVDPVRGDAGAAALRLLGMVQAAAPVAIATHGATQVAAAVWTPPQLYVVRWSRNRWVVGYRLAGGSRPNDYVRSEGRIPGHLETGQLVRVGARRGVRDVHRRGPDAGLAAVPGAGPARARPRRRPPAGSGRRRAGGSSAAEKAPPARPAPRKVRAAEAAAGPEAAAAPDQPALPGLQHAPHAARSSSPAPSSASTAATDCPLRIGPTAGIPEPTR